MRAGLLAPPIAVLALPAFAQSLQLSGKFGYLSEYELSAKVAAHASNRKREFSGPMIVRHVGVCTHDGPDQVDGTISLRFSDAASRVKAVLVFDGHECTFSGKLSETDGDELVCRSAAVPFIMWSQ